MKKTISLTAILLTVLFFRAAAQNMPQPLVHCGYDLYWDQFEKENPGARQRYTEYIRSRTDQLKDHAAKPTGVIYRIPIVFHVVYYQKNGVTKGNIPDSALIYQIEILNDAYRKRNADTGNLRDIFKPLIADAEIEFYLATKDPNGNPTSGITRTPTEMDGFGDATYSYANSIERIKIGNEGGKDPWPVSHYLNIWIADMGLPTDTSDYVGAIGHGTPPSNPFPPNWSNAGLSPNIIDGVIIQFPYIGGMKNPYMVSAPSYAKRFKDGRTAVHEVGHYLGLVHIFGNIVDPAVSCTAAGDDGINDTPLQATVSNAPLPTQNSCHASVAGDLPDLWENYMDYTRDSFKVMFTRQQVDFMRDIVTTRRDTLINQYPTGIYNQDTRYNTIVVYPQPARQNLVIAFERKIDLAVLTDMLGKTVKTVKASKVIDISRLPSGMYFLKLR